jgi:hypothetical protein
MGGAAVKGTFFLRHLRNVAENWEGGSSGHVKRRKNIVSIYGRNQNGAGAAGKGDSFHPALKNVENRADSSSWLVKKLRDTANLQCPT